MMLKIYVIAEQIRAEASVHFQPCLWLKLHMLDKKGQFGSGNGFLVPARTGTFDFLITVFVKDIPKII